MPGGWARLFWPACATALSCAVLVALGVWQLHRLAAKEILFAQIEARAKAPPGPLPDEDSWPALRPEAYEYRHVVMEGIFEHSRETLVFRATGGGTTGVTEPGYLVLTPLRLRTGARLIVNRGFVPAGLKDRTTRIAGELPDETRVTGLMRAPETRSFFTPLDKPEKGLFFTSDPISIAASLGLERSAPFLVDADDLPVPGGWPKGGTTELVLRNNHLSYAVTWFGLAFACLAVFVVFARQGSRRAS